MLCFLRFLVAVFRNWQVLVTGFIATVLIGGIEHYLQVSVSWHTYLFVLCGLIFVACFLAWKENDDALTEIQRKVMEDAPRFLLEVVLDKGEAPVKVRIQNTGATEMHSPAIDPLEINGGTVTFPSLIAIIAAGKCSEDLIPTGPGVFGRHDLRGSMMAEWGERGGLATRELVFPATGSFFDRNGVRFLVSWEYVMDPMFSHFQARRGPKPNMPFIPDVTKTYLTVRTIKQRPDEDRTTLSRINKWQTLLSRFRSTRSA